MVTTYLHNKNVQVICAEPASLGSLDIHLEQDDFYVNRQLVTGILFRSVPDTTFSEGFALADRRFCDAEIRAVWLAALNLKTILAVNRYDAVAWFEGTNWPIWRRRLLEAEIPVSPFYFGNHLQESNIYWYPYLSTENRPAPGAVTKRMLAPALTQNKPFQENLIVWGNVVFDSNQPYMTDVAKLLENAGIRIALVSTDSNGHILSINTQPMLANKKITNEAAQIIVDGFYDHLYSR